MARRLLVGTMPARQPSTAAGLLVAAVGVTLTTLLVYPLKHVAPVLSLGVAYLVIVLLVSTIWPAWLGALTGLASAAAFNWFHIPPTGHFAIARGENWIGLAAFVAAALLTSSVADAARSRAEEADERRQEADLAAELARTLLRGGPLEEALPAVAQQIATALDVPGAAIELGEAAADHHRVAFALNEGERRIGTLLLPAATPEPVLRRVQARLVPSLEASVATALERDSLLGEVVETAALRRSDVVKTALLRTVSHDLRSPLTAILATADALQTASTSDEERRELAGAIADEARRLSKLIDNLLDLSRLEGDAAEPRREWSSVEEVIHAAIEDVDAPRDAFKLAIDRDLPPVRADPAQLERAFANLLENARRHGAGHPVSVRARDVGGRILVRVVDRGRGVAPAERERIFEPFYRADGDRGEHRGPGVGGEHRGSGLGLAIVRGFVEANGGRVWVESLPGQATSFVVELPLEPAAAPARV